MIIILSVGQCALATSSPAPQRSPVFAPHAGGTFIPQGRFFRDDSDEVDSDERWRYVTSNAAATNAAARFVAPSVVGQAGARTVAGQAGARAAAGPAGARAAAGQAGARVAEGPAGARAAAGQAGVHAPAGANKPQTSRGQSRFQHSFEDENNWFSSYEDDDAKYDFNWDVSDEETHVKRHEARQGDSTTGSYSVLLPDGRMQVVTYHVDGTSGYVAKVHYEGTATVRPRHHSHESFEDYD
ncbi:Insect cuticle protein [Trinorchestia longiramus]|nr:Insect cuticle protein [Trinorchestia longiramus]